MYFTYIISLKVKFYEENHILPVHVESNSPNLAGVSKTAHASIVMVKIHKNTKHINMLDFVISCLTIKTSHFFL